MWKRTSRTGRPRGGSVEDSITGVDRHVLELLETVALPLCHGTIAVNLGRSPTEVRVSCQKLGALGLIDELDHTRRAFELNRVGEDYLAGNVDLDAIGSW